MTATIKKFDLIDALIADGFKREADITTTCEINGEYVEAVYIKEYAISDRVNDYGVLNEGFEVEVHVLYHNGRCYGVRVFYGNGKIKDHEYGKRAYNAIRDTLKYAGFDIAYKGIEA